MHPEAGQQEQAALQPSRGPLCLPDAAISPSRTEEMPVYWLCGFFSL